MKNVLIIGAHYDDCDLGVGGTAAKLSDQGKKVYKLTLTDNVTNSETLHVHIDYEASAHESASACKILKINEITNYIPVRCCQLHYTSELMQKIESVIYEYSIDTVFAHFMDDVNQDHVEASKICTTAARHCENIFLYHSNLYLSSNKFIPNFFIDISRYISKKKDALDQYSKDHNRFQSLFETVIDRNHVWGYEHQVSYAEAFVVYKYLMR